MVIKFKLKRNLEARKSIKIVHFSDGWQSGKQQSVMLSIKVYFFHLHF
jgi:hypothetical protein